MKLPAPAPNPPPQEVHNRVKSKPRQSHNLSNPVMAAAAAIHAFSPDIVADGHVTRYQTVNRSIAGWGS